MAVSFVDQVMAYLANSANRAAFINASSLGTFAGVSSTRRYGQNGFQNGAVFQSGSADAHIVLDTFSIADQIVSDEATFWGAPLDASGQSVSNLLMKPSVAPMLQRTLSAVYRFYDAFFFPIDEDTPPVTSPLDVSIPALRWSAVRAETDFTYRFSALTLTHSAPVGVNLEVQVVAPNGDYVSLEPILLTLPLPLSVPPKAADFLITKPLWPTVAVRPPEGETAVRGHIHSPTAQPVAGLKVEMWSGGSVTPPPGTPFTRSNANGEFLFRFPLLKGTAGSVAPFHIRVNNGAVAVSPATPSIMLGRTHISQFERI